MQLTSTELPQKNYALKFNRKRPVTFNLLNVIVRSDQFITIFILCIFHLKILWCNRGNNGNREQQNAGVPRKLEWYTFLSVWYNVLLKSDYKH